MQTQNEVKISQYQLSIDANIKQFKGHLKEYFSNKSIWVDLSIINYNLLIINLQYYSF